MTCAVLLVDPKYPHNVSGALRACALLGADALYVAGERVQPPDQWPIGARLPREERMRVYDATGLYWVPRDYWERPFDFVDATRRADLPMRSALTPVCVEIVPGAEPLVGFSHPRHALYVFGPEDGGVPKGIRHACHRFVRIPTAWNDDQPLGRTPFNLSAAVNIALYARLASLPDRDVASYAPIDEIERASAYFGAGR